MIKKLSGKIVLAAIIVLIAAIIVMNIFLSIRLVEHNNSFINEKINSYISGLKLYLDDSKNNSKIAAISMASKPDVIKAVKERDRGELLRLLVPHLVLRASYYTISDNEGIVLARTYQPEIFGDSLFYQQNIKDALNGKVSSYFEKGTVVKVSVRTGAPVYDTDGTIIGVISAGVRLDSDATIQELKQLFGCEFSVSLGNERLATTLYQDGKNLKGTTIDSGIAEIVLANKTEYIGDVNLNGEHHYVFYMPLINAEGKAFAIVSMGLPLTNISAETSLTYIEGIAVILAGLLFGLYFFYQNLREKQQLKTTVEERTAELNRQQELLKAEYEKSVTVAHWYKSILDATPLPISVTDENMKWTFVNRAVEDFLGTKFEDMLGKHCSNWNATICHTPECGIACAKRGERQTFFNHKSSLYQVDVETLQDLHGKISGYIEVVQDITKIKSMAKSQAEAETAASAKSTFLANMGHEIRTPMNSIIGFVELALDDDISDKTKDYLNQILENSNWLMELLNTVLDISKYEKGKLELEKIPFNLREIFTHCQSIIKPMAYEKGLELYFYAEPTVGKSLIGDSTRLKQVFDNLLTNAVKYTNSGIVKMHAYVVDINDTDCTIGFEVKDSGIGMTPEQMEKVFNSFVQADSSITRKYGGSGLGLTIAKHIVELMGGELEVESTLGVGSKFSFKIVFDIIDAPESYLHKRAIEENPLTKPVFDAEILICEDNVMNQRVICEHLDRVGIKQIVAENGKVGVDTVRARKEAGLKPFDLIFMDIHMPVMDGLEAAERMGQLKIGTPIVAMTANIMRTDMELMQKNGMLDFIAKPFTSKELWRCLLKYLTPLRTEDISRNQQIKEEDEIYRQMVADFLRGNQNRYGEIVTAINAGDLITAHRHAHSLKINAAHIKRTSLSKIAFDMEQLLVEGSLPTDKQMDSLKTELSAVIAELASQSQNGPAVKDVNTPMEEKKIRILFDTLKQMLLDHDSGCIELIDELKQVPGSSDIINHIENCDFVLALEMLSNLRKEMGSRNGS
jgi:PAS domain S-box-containing protein